MTYEREDTWTAICCRNGIPVCEHGFCSAHHEHCEQCADRALRAELNESMERLKASIRRTQGERRRLKALYEKRLQHKLETHAVGITCYFQP